MIKCFHKAADSKFDDAYTRTLCLFLLAFLLVFFIWFILAARRCYGLPNKILIIVYVNNFQVQIS